MPELNFNSDEVEPVGSFEPLPVGEYLVMITASEKKPTKDGTGEYLQFTYDVLDGEYKGRHLFDRLNIRNPSETAEKIAKGSLSAICHVVHVARPKNTEELHDIPFMVRIAIRPPKDEFAASNVIKEYKYADGRSLKDVKRDAPCGTVPAETKVPAAGESKGKKKLWEK